jgi:2-haloacid dehalogenase
MNSQIHDNVAKLGAPFYAVYTAESAQAYKPRMQAFEYMFDQLGWGGGRHACLLLLPL